MISIDFETTSGGEFVTSSSIVSGIWLLGLGISGVDVRDEMGVEVGRVENWSSYQYSTVKPQKKKRLVGVKDSVSEEVKDMVSLGTKFHV